MRRAVVGWVAMLAVAGCGGGSSPPGTAGRGGSAGATGGGAAGTAGAAGGAGAGSVAGTGGGLPACDVASQPNDPDAGVCNTVTVTGAPIVAELVVGTYNGIYVDGGTVEMPAGGTILDGDYDLVRWQERETGLSTRRTMRVFGSGAFIEWAGVDLGSVLDGGELNFRYNSSQHVMGTNLVVDHVDCTSGSSADNYGFTVSGDLLALFNSTGGGGSVAAVDTYRRTCARP